MCASSLRRLSLRLVLLLLMLAEPGGAMAQQPGGKEAEQVRRLRLQVQKLQQDLASQQDTAQRAQAEKARADEEAKARQGRLAVLQSQLRLARAEVAQAQERTNGLQQVLEERQKALQALEARLALAQGEQREAASGWQSTRAELAGVQRQLAARESAHADLLTRHASQAQGLQVCINSNLALRDIGLELLQRYAHKSVAEVLAENEPFLQYRRVALENLMQDYQDKLDRQALAAPAPPAPAGGGIQGGGRRAP